MYLRVHELQVKNPGAALCSVPAGIRTTQILLHTRRRGGHFQHECQGAYCTCDNRILCLVGCVSSSLLKQLRDVSDKLDRSPPMLREGHSSIHCVFTSYLLAMRGIYFMSLVAPLERYLRLSPQLRWRLLRIIPVQACSRKCVKKGR